MIRRPPRSTLFPYPRSPDLRQRELRSRLRAACAATGGDYGGGRLALLVLALLYVGARRLEHLRYVAGDPLIARFCGLARLPTARTMGNWLRQFTQVTLAPLVQLNHDLVIDAITRLALPRLTIDVDGTVVCTGATVGWAFRGFNPHHRKDPSYYPLLAHVAPLHTTVPSTSIVRRGRARGDR